MGAYVLYFSPLVPSLLHSRGSIFGASGSLCVFGGRGEQAAGDTKVEIFNLFKSILRQICQSFALKFKFPHRSKCAFSNHYLDV